MLDQVVNITGLKSFSAPTSNDQQSAVLPAKNSVVSLSVLDKAAGDYKILINGKVFQAALPVNVKQGDSMLGVVINNNPMVLNLVNILNLKSLTMENLTLLLAKLGLKKTDGNISLLKAFIINKKPIIKNQLDKFAEILEELDFQFDEFQLNYIIQVFTNDQNFKSFDKNCAEYFRYPVPAIINEIYSVIVNGAEKNSAIDQIGSMLSINPEKENYEKGILAALINSDKVIAVWIKENKNNNSAKVQKLVALFSRYLVQKDFLRREGIYPGFVILKKKDETELVEYKLEKGAREDGSVHYLLNIGMRSYELGDINIDGLLSKSNLSLNIGVEENKKKYFEEEFDGLKENFIKNLGLFSFININSGSKVGGKNKNYSLNESINFRA